MRLRPLLAFDFDGTLAPTVPRHHEARVSKSVSRWISQLSDSSPVAILTGRSVADVSSRLGFVPRYIVGSHGSEVPEGLRAGRADALDAVRDLLACHAAGLYEAGVQVEDKHHSLTFHYRLARNHAFARRRITEALGASSADLKVFDGKCAVNVVPADAPDTGEAVVALVRACGAGAAVFVGDDGNDEHVFARAECEWLTVRIGRDDRRSQARFFLDSPSEVATLLQRMLALLDGY